MTDREWNESHPAQCTAYIAALERKLERNANMEASNKLLHCQIHGVKIDNRKPRIEDFLSRKKTTKKSSESLSIARAQVAEIQSQSIAKRNQK